ncbi:hypothetical protein O3P69_006172 [Scylla paramamosain]|uniref:WW domain-containing protein n=1 Tax=Scylla paramamosain TaxID=85552 RepID=A0AAW0U6Z3_SCYPA
MAIILDRKCVLEPKCTRESQARSQTMAGRILPLPDEVRCQLRSGVAIASVAQCVEELVLNSLDAGATCVAVRVDLSIFRIQVVDNGEGVPQSDLKYLGRRHATSKCHSLKDLSSNLCHYGFRGEALASIVNLSAIVDITTRPQGSPRTLTKLFTFGKERSVSTAKINRPSIGTTITIQEFMHNMPVRQKLVREAIDVESIRMRLESFALMHPKVAFSLRNDRTSTMVVQTKKSSGTLATFLQLFGVERAQGMAEVHHSLGPFTVSGYIGTQPHLTKALQFVYINKRVVLKTKIHRMLNDLLARSSIISARLHPSSVVPSSVGPNKTPSSPPKGMRLYGMFVLNIECPYSEYDICLDPSKTLVQFKDWNRLLLCIEELVLQFASEENLMISLDERFRLSGKDQEEGEEEVEEEEEKLSLSQSSQSRLQVFSLKRSCEGSKEDEKPGPAKQKYGKTLNTQDNLLAVHSVMVKRARRESKVYEEDKEINCDNDELHSNNEATKECSDKRESNFDTTQKDDDSTLGAMRNKIRKYCEDNSEDENEERSIRINHKDSQADTSRHVEATTVTPQGSPGKSKENDKSSVSHSLPEFEELSVSGKSNSENTHVSESSESDETVSLAAKRKEGVRSVLEEFKKVLEEVNERDKNTESDLEEALALTESSTQEERRGGNVDRNTDRTVSNTGTLSTLQEFMNFNMREEEKEALEGCHTPEEYVRGTPTSPPPLKSLRASSPSPSAAKNIILEACPKRTWQSSTDPESQREFDFKAEKRKASDVDNEGHIEKRVTRASPREARHGKNQSLSKSLSEKFRNHQNRSRALQSLQKFGYSKTKPTQNIQETYFAAREKILGGGRSTVGSNVVGNSVMVSAESPRLSTYDESTQDKGSEECLDASFKFDPVITKTFQDVDTCRSHIQSCRKNEPSMDMLLDNSAVDTESGRVEKIYCNPIIGVSSECGNGRSGVDGSCENVMSNVDHSGGNGMSVSDGNVVDGSSDSRLSTLNQRTTTPKKTSSLFNIAMNYASSPEGSDGSPEKPSAHNTPLKVPQFLGFEESLAHPKGAPTGPPHVLGDTCTVVKPAQKCTGSGTVNISGQRDRVANTFVESEIPRIVNESVTNINTSHWTSTLCETSNKSNSFNERTLPVYDKDCLSHSVHKGGTQFKVLQNSIDSSSASYSVPITQAFEVSKPVTHQEAYRETQEMQESICQFQPSQGFTPSSIEPGIQRLSLSADESWVPACSQQVQDAVDSARAVSVEHEEAMQKETSDQISDSKVLESPNVLSEEPLTDTEPLPSQMNIGNSSAGVCRPPVPEPSLALNTHPLPSSQGGEVPEVQKGCGPTSQTSPNPFSESLHFSQLTLPEEGSSEASSGTNTLLASSSLSLGLPFTYHSSGNSEPLKKKMSSCDITFQGKVIQMGNRKEIHKGSVEVSKESDCDVNITPSLLERIHGSDNSSSAFLEATQKISIDSSSSVQSFKNANGHKDPESSKPEYPVLGKDSNSCQDLKSSHEGMSEQREVTPCETQRSPQASRWQEAVDKEGRRVYVDLQTGNSSYEPPEVKDSPAWTCSQPLGARLPKVPLTHEPGYVPRGSGQRDRDSFTLSHGFTELMSWKKTIEMRKRESVGQAGSVRNPEPGCSGAWAGGTMTTSSGVTQGVQEALESLLEDCEADNDFVKWTEKPETSPQKSAQPSQVAQICQMWEPPDFAMEAEVLNSGPEGAGPRGSSGVRVYNMIHPYRFSQEMLHSCKVLGQLDEKFIACSLTYQNPEGAPGSASQLVVLFDQHAVHERVRLETIIQENCERLDSGETVLSKSAVIPPLELDLPEDEVRLMQAYAHKFNQRGLYFTRASPSKVLFQLIPSCLVPREANEVRQKRCQTAGAIVESVVRDLCHTMHQTGGVLGLIPRPISHVFNTNACRGAIKFGDTLTIKECRDLLASLCSCQLPFQCAHGRPSVVPVVNLTHLASRTPKRINKPNLRKLREAMDAGCSPLRMPLAGEAR